MRIQLRTALVVFCLLPACALSDLRPRELRESGPTVERELRGRAILDKAIEIAGGRNAWARFESAEMRLADEWRGWVGYFFRPWPENPTQLDMHFDLRMQGAQGTFRSEKHRGEVWGLNGKRTWSQKAGEERVYRDRESVRFILAAYQYFFELPQRIVEAPIVLYAGSPEREGRPYDLVFITWGRPEPHGEHDQYLLWIPHDTGRIEIAQYTIRDKFRFATGVNFFSDFRSVDGIVLPHAYWIAQHLDDEDFVHRVQLEDVHFTSARPSPANGTALK